MAMMDSMVATKERVDKLKRLVEERKSRKDEYAEIISRQSKGSFPCKLVLFMMCMLFASTSLFICMILLLNSCFLTSTIYILKFYQHVKRSARTPNAKNK